jgi:hypothetical protein
MRRLVLALAVAVALAGCIGALDDGELAVGTSSDDGPGPVENTTDELTSLLKADHDHTDVAGHEHVESFELEGYNPLIGTSEEPTSYADVDLHNTTAAVSTKQPQGGFVLVDVEDPDAPEVLSYYESGPNYQPDAKFGPDGDYVFMATHGGAVTTDPETVRGMQDDESPTPYGVHMVDVTDRRDPDFVSYMQCGSSGVHNVHTTEVDGTTWVFGACYDSFVNRVVIGQVEEGPEGQETLVRTGEFSLGSFVEGNRGSVHDMVVNEDPKTGDPILTVSYGSEGVVWVDISDPSSPEMLGQWNDMPMNEEFLHYAELYTETVDGKRIVVGAPEYWSHPHSGFTWIIDATDWENPETLGTWRLSDDLTYETGYLYSPHNFELRDGKIFLAHNHAGLHAIDFASSPDRLEDPKHVGTYLKAKDPGHDIRNEYANDYWGIQEGPTDDTFVVSDRGAGLHVVEFTPDAS